MRYQRPFITERFTAHEGDSRTRTVSLAVRVMDAFTREPARVKLRVLLRRRRELRAIRNLSGAYFFEDVPDDDYILLVEPDPVTADWFFLQPEPGDPWTNGFERPITLPLADPLQVVTLAPHAGYPFPAGATLLRGIVTSGQNPVSGAVVNMTYDQVDPADPDQTVLAAVETQTDKDGQFVLYFRELPQSSQTVTAHAESGGLSVDVQVQIHEGRTEFVELPL